LYKRLPVVYAAAASTCMLAFGWQGPALLSEVTLFAAAMTTAVWRYRAADERRRCVLACSSEAFDRARIATGARRR